MGKFGAKLLCIILGCGTLLLWNTVLTGLDYLNLLFSHCQLDYVPIANFMGNLLFLIIQLRWKGNLQSKAVVGFLIYMAVIAYCVYLIASKDISDPQWIDDQHPYFSVLVAGMALAGAACASLQGSLFGMAGQLEDGSALCSCLMTGAALAGVITCASSIFGKVVLQAESSSNALEALRQSTLGYFTLSLAITAISLALLAPWLRHVRRNTQPPPHPAPTPARLQASWQKNTQPTPSHAQSYEENLKTHLLHDNAGAVAPASAAATECHGQEQRESISEAEWSNGGCEEGGEGSSMMLMACAALVCMAVTLGLFPGVTAERATWSHGDSQHWEAVIQVTLFNVGDLVGRAAAGAGEAVAVGSLWALALLRLAFGPLTVCLARDVTLFSQWHDWVNRAGGFLATSIMRHPAARGSETMLLLALTAGLGLGSLLALPLAELSIP